MRPSHFSTEIDLILGSSSLSGIGTSPDPKADAKFVDDLVGTNVTRTGQIITLDYQEVPEIIQPYSSQVTSASAYSSSFFNGTLELFPSSDVWVDQIRIEPKLVNVEGDYVKNELELEDEGFDQQSGFSPTVWNSWETIWTGEVVNKTSEEVTLGNQIIQEDYEQVTKTGTSTRTGKRKILKEVFENTSFGDQVLDSSVVPYIRSRNIEFTGRRLKPFTQLYSFFDGIDVVKYIMPKLIQVTMLDGTFTVGEDVVGYAGKGYTPSSGIGNKSARRCGPLITFKARVAQHNHKFGPYNSPTQKVIKNPYDRESILSDTYSSSSTILNIDTYSLANKSQGEFYSKPNVGMVLVGRESGAQARVTSLDLFTDQVGDVIGCLWIPNPNVDVNPKFEAGTKVFKITSSSTNSNLEGTVNCSAEEQYYSEGKVDKVQENIIVTRNSRVETEDAIETSPASEIGDNELVNSTVVGTIEPPYTPPVVIPAPNTTGITENYYTPTKKPPENPKPILEDRQPKEPEVINQAGSRLGGQGTNRLNDALILGGLEPKATQGMDNAKAQALYNKAVQANPAVAEQYSFGNTGASPNNNKNANKPSNNNTKKDKEKKAALDKKAAKKAIKKFG